MRRGLHVGLPKIVLNPHALRRRPGLRGAAFARCRRVIEIRDGGPALRPREGGTAPPLRPSTVRPFWKPTVIAAALEDKRAGRSQGRIREQSLPAPTGCLASGPSRPSEHPEPSGPSRPPSPPIRPVRSAAGV
ncbi:DUF6545 domain-containing protein [Streptomyces sp. NPDC096132]|uniref:DUF6545 domain-containing protein n=1 Tax=Streptomyces sp. NPDC096132 TaxID=3366075 RepID=UPI00380D4BFE